MGVVRDSMPRLSALQRRTMVDGRWESKLVSEPDLSDDLALFIACDINKPAWSDKYSRDTTFDAFGRPRMLEHIAADASMRTKSMRIFFKEGKVDSLSIVYGSENVLMKNTQTLNWKARQGYGFSSLQEVPVFGLRHTYGVDVGFVR
jgi:hypothetical protein